MVGKSWIRGGTVVFNASSACIAVFIQRFPVCLYLRGAVSWFPDYNSHDPLELSQSPHRLAYGFLGHLSRALVAILKPSDIFPDGRLRRPLDGLPPQSFLSRFRQPPKLADTEALALGLSKHTTATAAKRPPYHLI